MEGQVKRQPKTGQPHRAGMSARTLAVVAAVLVVVAVAGRLAPHAPNFTPVAAAALFAGWCFASRGRAWVGSVVPVAAMLISDLFVGFYEWPVMLTVYAALAAPALLGRRLADGCSSLGGAGRVAGASLASSVLFFVSTNFAVWAWSGWYERTAPELAAAFIAALPFFKYTLAGDLVWSAAFFGAFALMAARRPLATPAARHDSAPALA